MSVYRRFPCVLLSLLVVSTSNPTLLPFTTSVFASTTSPSSKAYFSLVNTEYEPRFQQIIVSFSNSSTLSISSVFDIEFYKGNKWISTNQYARVTSPANATYEASTADSMVLDTFPFDTKTPGTYRVKLFIKRNGKKETIYLPFKVIDPIAREAESYKDLTYESDYLPSSRVASHSSKYSDSFYTALPSWVMTQLKRGYKLSPLITTADGSFTIHFDSASYLEYGDIYLSVSGQNTTIDTLTCGFSLPHFPMYQADSKVLTPEFTPSTLSILAYTEAYISDFLEAPFALTVQEKKQLIEAIVKEQPLTLKKQDYDVTLKDAKQWMLPNVPSFVISLHKERQIKLDKAVPSFIDEEKSRKLFSEIGFNNADTQFCTLPDYQNYHHVVDVDNGIDEPVATDGYFSYFEQSLLVNQSADSTFSSETFYTAKFCIPEADFIQNSNVLLVAIKKKVIALQAITQTKANEKVLDQLINDLANWKAEAEAHDYSLWSPNVLPESLQQDGSYPISITYTFIPRGLSKKAAPPYIVTSDAYADEVFICFGWYGN